LQVQKTKPGFKQVKWYYGKVIEIPEAWAVERLGKLCKLRKNDKVKSNLYVGLEHIAQGSNTLDGRGNVSDFTSTKNEFHEGDVLYGKLRPNLNKVWLATESGHCSTDVLPIVASQKILNRMLLLILSNHYFYSYAVGTSAGTKMPRTNWPDIKKFIVFLPPLNEQQKTAFMLSNVDSLINQTKKIIEQTQGLKKGLVQQLLTKGIGHTKFKKVQFGTKWMSTEIPLDWDFKKLKKLATFRQGLQIAKTERFDEPGIGRLKLIKVDDFLSGKENPEYINVPSESRNAVVCDRDDLIIARTGTLGLVLTNVEGVFHNNTFAIDYNRNLFKKMYFFYYLTSYLVQLFIKIISTRTSQSDLTHKEFGELGVPIPPKEEQKKIATILGTVDSKISDLESKKSKLELLKKGLMQKLLTGQIRV